MQQRGMFCKLTQEEYDQLAEIARNASVSGAAWMRLQILSVGVEDIRGIVDKYPTREAARNVEFNRLCTAAVKDKLVEMANRLDEPSEAVVLRALLYKAIDEQVQEKSDDVKETE